MKKGFTLIEIIVSVTIFTIVVLAGIGAILSINSVSRRAQKIKITMDNLNFALEGIARELRLGSQYDCNNSDVSTSDPVREDCSTGGSSIAFLDSEPRPDTVPSKGHLIKYNYDANLHRIEKFDPERFGPEFFDITAPDIEISSLIFYVTGTTLNDNVQPKIVVTVSGRAGTEGKGDLVDFRLQTTIAQRIVDFQ